MDFETHPVGTVNKLKWMREYELSLNRRAKVEQELWDIYHDKQPLPDKEKCRQWALALGVPFPVATTQVFTQEPVAMVHCPTHAI